MRVIESGVVCIKWGKIVKGEAIFLALYSLGRTDHVDFFF